MSYDYSENILVQESVDNLLHDELGRDVRFAYNIEVLGKVVIRQEQNEIQTLKSGIGILNIIVLRWKKVNWLRNL